MTAERVASEMEAPSCSATTRVERRRGRARRQAACGAGEHGRRCVMMWRGLAFELATTMVLRLTRPRSASPRAMDGMSDERLRALIEALSTGGAIAQARAAGSLADLAGNNDANQVAIAEAGGIEPLIELVRSGTAWAPRSNAAAGAASNLASTTPTRRRSRRRAASRR